MIETEVNTTAAELNRLYWHSRRGMLELDLLLVPFAEQHVQHLTAGQLELYRLLLVEEDQDLFSWLTGRELAPNSQLQTIIELILRKHAEQKTTEKSL